MVLKYLKPLAINKYIISDTLAFPDILTKNLLDNSEEYVSYDVYQLFTSSIYLSETIL